MQRNRHSAEFKEQALSKARERGTRTLETVAVELNISPSSSSMPAMSAAR